MPVAPKKIASCPPIMSFQSSGIHAPVRAIRSQSQSKWSKASSKPNLRAAASSARTPSGMTSFPMPSPGITAMRYRVMLLLLGLYQVGRDGRATVHHPRAESGARGPIRSVGFFAHSGAEKKVHHGLSGIVSGVNGLGAALGRNSMRQGPNSMG